MSQCLLFFLDQRSYMMLPLHSNASEIGFVANLVDEVIVTLKLVNNFSHEAFLYRE